MPFMLLSGECIAGVVGNVFWEIFEGPWPSFHHHGLKSVIRQTSASPPHDLKREGHGQRTPTSLDILCLAKQLVVSTGGANPISWFELWLTIRRSGWCAGCGRFSIAPSSALAARGTLAPAPIATFAPHGWRCRGPVFDGLPVRLWADKWLGQDPSWLGIGALSSQAAGVENQWYLIYIFWTSKIMNCLNQWVATCTAHYLIPTIQSKGSLRQKIRAKPQTIREIMATTSWQSNLLALALESSPESQAVPSPTEETASNCHALAAQLRGFMVIPCIGKECFTEIKKHTTKGDSK